MSIHASLLSAYARPRHLFHGWYIVLCGFLAHSMRMGLGDQTFGFFFQPMRAELGWSRSLLTAGVTLRYVVQAVMAPFVGYVVDRYGPRGLMAGGAALLGLSLLWLSQVSDPWSFLLAFGVIGALGMPGLNHSVINPTIAKWFVQRRGLATGLAHAGINVGTIALVPLVVSLLNNYGWRTTWLLLAGLPWLVVIPPALAWLHRQPEDLGLRPDGADVAAADRASEECTWTPGAAMRTSTLWLLTVSGVLMVMAYTGDLIHRIPYMLDLGFSKGEAATTLVIYHAAALSAKFVWGPLGDRLALRPLAITLALGSAGSLLLLVEAKAFWQLAAYGLIYGLTVGGVFIMDPLLWAGYFGRRFLGTIRGRINPIILLASGCGPLVAARMYDALGSYQMAFLMFLLMFVLAAVCLIFVRPPVHQNIAPTPTYQ